MNYLTEIKLFYDWLETHNLPPKGIVLWHGLMQIANRSGWKTPLEIPSNALEMRTHMERTAIFRVRESLVDFGLIRLVQKGGRATCSYILVPLSSNGLVLHNETQINVVAESVVLQNEAQNATQNGKKVATENDFVLQEMLQNKMQNATQTDSIPITSFKTKLNIDNNRNIKEIEVASADAQHLLPEAKSKRKSCAEKKTTNESPQDENFVKFQRWIEQNAPNVGKMKEPFSLAQFLKLKERYSTDGITSVLLAMENYVPLGKNNRSAYLTACNWLSRRTGDSHPRGQPDPNRPQYGQRIGQIMQTEDEAKRNRYIERLRNAGQKK